MTDFATTYLTLVVLAATLVTLAWLLAGFLLALESDCGEITDKPIRGFAPTAVRLAEVPPLLCGRPPADVEVLRVAA